MENIFSPNSSTDLRSDAHQSQIIRGDAGEDHTQSVGGIQSNYWGDIFSRVSAPLHMVQILVNLLSFRNSDISVLKY